MKKIICTIMVMVTLMTTAGAVNTSRPTRTMREICEEFNDGLIVVTSTRLTGIWGLPMTHYRVKLFGIEDALKYDVYDFELELAESRTGS